MNKLIINADDFGASAEINDGIIYLLENNFVSSSTLMLGMSATEDAIKYVQKKGIKNIGLHLNLSDGCSITNKERKLNYIVEYNNLNMFYQLRHRNYYLKEISEQIKYISKKIDITHLDGHRHTQIYPPLLGEVIRAMKRFKIFKMRREFTYLHKQNIAKKLVKKSIIKKIRSNNIITTDYFFDLAYFIKNIELINRFKNKTIEIMCHPSTNSSDFNTLISNDFAIIKKQLQIIGHKDL